MRFSAVGFSKTNREMSVRHFFSVLYSMRLDFNHNIYQSDTLNRTECLAKCGKWQSLPGINDIDKFSEVLEKVLTHKGNKLLGHKLPSIQAHLAIIYNYTTNEFHWSDG